MRIFYSFFFYLFVSNLVAQEIVNDSITKLNEVLITTGQYSKQSIKKSVFEVKVIDSKVIEQNAANNLADLLNQNLNIHILPNTGSGKSEVSLFGLDGQYFKILQDGVPIISENGFGNNVDLTQINLDNIKQVEIVEGSMSVVYGANAVSGIINLITKTGSRKQWDISTTIQEETVGGEYELWKKGRHILSTKIGSNFTKNLFGSFTFSRNNFAGFQNRKQGNNYIENDGLRGYEWLPKDQLTLNSVVNCKKNGYSFFYNYVHFKEFLHSYTPSITTSNINGYCNKTANDSDFKNIRNSHTLNISGKLFKKSNFNISNSYQTQHKLYQDYVYDLFQRTSNFDMLKEYQYRKTFFSKGALSNFIETNWFNAEIGYEVTNENGFGSSVASAFNTVDVEKTLSNYDVFVSSEIAVDKIFSIRPGFRYSIQSKFKNQRSYSLSSSYKLRKGFRIRATLGSSFRTPNYDELYTYFVDSSHNLTGNENLIPENSFSAKLHLKKKYYSKNAVKLSNKISLGYMNVKNKIDLAIVSTTPMLAHSFININTHESVNISTENNFQHNFLKVSVGGTLLGIKSKLEVADDTKEEFLFTPQVNTSLSYRLEQTDTSFSLTYKYNGKREEFVQRTEENEGETSTVIVKGVSDGYSWMNASVKKDFNNKFSATIGARNLFDVTSIKSTSSMGGDVHADNSYNKVLGYGRSYFIKLTYQNK